MASRLRLLITIFCAGLAVGALALLIMPSSAIEEARPLGTTVRASDLPVMSCEAQLWPNRERVCVKGSTKRREAAKQAAPGRAENITAASAPSADTSLPQAPEANPVALRFGEMAPPTPALTENPVVAVTPPPPPPPRVKSETARVRTAHAPIPITRTGANGSRRTVMIRPTSQQDVYYYLARRNFAAAGTPFGFPR